MVDHLHLDFLLIDSVTISRQPAHLVHVGHHLNFLLSELLQHVSFLHVSKTGDKVPETRYFLNYHVDSWIIIIWVGIRFYVLQLVNISLKNRCVIRINLNVLKNSQQHFFILPFVFFLELRVLDWRLFILRFLFCLIYTFASILGIKFVNIF